MINDVKNEIETLVLSIMDEEGFNPKYYEGKRFTAFLSRDISFKDSPRVNHIYCEGGGEGEGEHVEAVFSVDGKFYKATWNYYSHYGYSWDGLMIFEVAPKEQTVTVYSAI